MRSGILPMLFLLSPLLLVIATGSGSAEDCEECHSSSSSYPSGGYVYVPPPIYVVYDSSYAPGSNFQLRLFVSPQSDYDIRDVKGRLSLESGNVIAAGGEPRSSVDGGGRTVLTWEMEALYEGSAPFTITCDYTVHYRHTTGNSFDNAEYRKILTGNLIIADVAVQASPGTVGLSETGESAIVNITARANITELDADPDGSIADLIDITALPSYLSEGDTVSMTVTLRTKESAEGNITLSWREGPEGKSLKIRVSIIPIKDQDRGIDWYHEFGKYTGILSLVLLLTGYFTGGTGPLKGYSNRLFKTAVKRIKFHCALSYEILALSVFHLAVLVWGPFRQQVWIWENSLGFIALGLMIIISLNGIFQKKMVKSIGYQNWKRIHAWGTYTATVLVIIHAVSIGTHFAWLRAIFA
ncbi:MAG: hypothetical protein ACMUIG_00210 [Thermoplasmatota archaeon]